MLYSVIVVFRCCQLVFCYRQVSGICLHLPCAVQKFYSHLKDLKMCVASILKMTVPQIIQEFVDYPSKSKSSLYDI